MRAIELFPIVAHLRAWCRRGVNRKATWPWSIVGGPGSARRPAVAPPRRLDRWGDAPRRCRLAQRRRSRAALAPRRPWATRPTLPPPPAHPRHARPSSPPFQPGVGPRARPPRAARHGPRSGCALGAPLPTPGAGSTPRFAGLERGVSRGRPRTSFALFYRLSHVGAGYVGAAGLPLRIGHKIFFVVAPEISLSSPLM